MHCKYRPDRRLCRQGSVRVHPFHGLLHGGCGYGRGPEPQPADRRGSHNWTMPGVIAIMVFMLLYAPCMVTVVMIIREAGLRWALFSIFGSMAFAFTLAIVVYQAGMRFF